VNDPDAIDASLARIASARLDGVGLAVERRDGQSARWFSVCDLLASDGAPAVLLSRIRGMRETPADYIRAEWLFESYSRAIADLGISFIVAERRLPDLWPDNLLMTAVNGLVAGTAVVSGCMTVTETDPVPDGPGISRVGGWRELADEFRQGFTALAEPIVAWTTRHRLRQEKTLWLAAGDRIAQSLVWCGRAFDRQEFAAELARELLDRPGPMAIGLETGTDVRGREQHLRTTCCLAYRVDGGGLCFGCPLNR
jgi:hypothetical protein